MKKEELDEQLKKLDVMYERFSIATQEVYDIWQKAFKDADPKVFEIAVEEVIKNEEYAPCVAVVNRYYKKLEGERQEIVNKARGCYTEVLWALGEKKDTNDYAAFLTMLTRYPREKRIRVAEDFRDKAISYSNITEADGGKKKTFRQLLKGYGYKG